MAKHITKHSIHLAILEYRYLWQHLKTHIFRPLAWGYGDFILSEWFCPYSYRARTSYPSAQSTDCFDSKKFILFILILSYICSYVSMLIKAAFCLLSDLELYHIKCRPVSLDDSKSTPYIHLCQLARRHEPMSKIKTPAPCVQTARHCWCLLIWFVIFPYIPCRERLLEQVSLMIFCER